MFAIKQMFLVNNCYETIYLAEFAGLPRIGDARRGGRGGGGAVPLLNNWGDAPGDIIGLLPP